MVISFGFQAYWFAMEQLVVASHFWQAFGKVGKLPGLKTLLGLLYDVRYCTGALVSMQLVGDKDAIAPWGTGQDRLLLGYEVLSKEGRSRIEEHQYKAGDSTPLDHVLNPFWEAVTIKLPRWLHPNVVTLLGFLPIVVSYVLSWYICPGIDTAPPRWLCFFMALSLFVYQTMDAVDGKQARRIGQSTPLGQLFDHGCDCLCCLSHHNMGVTFLIAGGSRWNLAGLAALHSSFFMAQWQEHYTGVLRTSFGPVGVTEIECALIGLALFAGILGPSALQSLMTTQLPGLTVAEFILLAWIVTNFAMMGLALYTTMTHKAQERKDYTQGKWNAPIIFRQYAELRYVRAITDLMPVLVLDWVLLFGWHPQVIAEDPRMLCLASGLLFFYLTAQMIVFSMARAPFTSMQYSMVPFMLLAFASRMAYLPFEMTAVKVTLGVYNVALIVYVWCWLVTVIWEIKDHLGICIFTVVDPQRNN